MIKLDSIPNRKQILSLKGKLVLLPMFRKLTIYLTHNSLKASLTFVLLRVMFYCNNMHIYHDQGNAGLCYILIINQILSSPVTVLWQVVTILK